MDLSNMLNGSNPNYSNNNGRKESNFSTLNQSNSNTINTSRSNSINHDKAPLYELGASLQVAISRDNNRTPPPTHHQQQQQQQQQLHRAGNPLSMNGLLSSPFRPNDSTESPRINAPPAVSTGSSNSIVFSSSLSANPTLWNPKLSLKLVMKDQPLHMKPSKRQRVNNHPEEANNLDVQLKTHEVFYRGDEPKLLLEDSYEIQGAYPRGFFVMMAKRNIKHNFVFEYPEHYWFEDLYGLRKSAYVCMRTTDGELYELHLKPSREKLYMFGYLIKHVDMIRIVKDSMNDIILQRKLPLVLDLDDTLVRLVGEGNDRYVPEADIPKCKDRVAVLKDGRRVVLTQRVHEFLDWAQNLFDISVCSLGDQNYVENVVNVLDPGNNRIRGILYSARSEHDYIKRSPDPGRPPKDLLALYSFCALKDKSLGSSFSLPLILDDETRMWPLEQHDNIIEVKCQANVPVWSVSLFPVVQETLAYVHQEFFRQLDIWGVRSQEAEQNGVVFTRLPPSATSVYKTYLRHILRDMIARPPLPLPPRSSSTSI
ncbi:unnamed protein product [Mucor hiemalis]